MRKIKFRGISTETGKFIYGDLVRRKGLRKNEIWQIVCNCSYNYVDPDSVAQLIGCDIDGNEVYEGDEIKSCFGKSCYANFHHYGGIIDGTYTFVQTHIISNGENEINFGHND